MRINFNGEWESRLLGVIVPQYELGNCGTDAASEQEASGVSLPHGSSRWCSAIILLVKELILPQLSSFPAPHVTHNSFRFPGKAGSRYRSDVHLARPVAGVGCS